MNNIRVMTPTELYNNVLANQHDLAQSIIVRINNALSNYFQYPESVLIKLNDCTLEYSLTKKVLDEVKDELETSNWIVLALEMKEPNVLFVNIQPELEDK